ncbi:hypothetical protein OQJ65_08930 [Vibrio sp. Sgm 22]|uniref:hypothetical protein n=1 Tax=Vibrio TaxID=662 RepID=UPI00073F5BCB|nr:MULTISPECIES: hypothetical protein [Vibrio]MCX2758210.1 hypothetical protein [Vibrio sp. 14G-20]MCX2775430.1 hypothetical protein [Vibrio sp. Sgm 22]
MKTSSKTEKDLKIAIDLQLEGLDIQQGTKERAFNAFLAIGKYTGRSPIHTANTLSAESTLEMLRIVDDIESLRRSGTKELEGVNPSYPLIVAFNEAKINKRPFNGTLKWKFICSLLLSKD